MKLVILVMNNQNTFINRSIGGEENQIFGREFYRKKQKLLFFYNMSLYEISHSNDEQSKYIYQFPK